MQQYVSASATNANETLMCEELGGIFDGVVGGGDIVVSAEQ